MDYIDFRSDTVTWPTPEMREAMAAAPVGDDVFGDDPTVIELENEAAARMGKEAALFMPSGTMSNAVALLTHCQRGEEIILGRQSHTFVSEAGGSAALGGIHPNPFDVQPDGTLPLDTIRRAIRSEDDHHPRTRLICLENTQSLMGGIPITAAYTEQVAALAHEYGLRLHLDGARIFNAAAALNVDVKELAVPADSVSFCLSKGLCAPVGSLLVGSKAFIKEARRNRKLLGGGMRQVGVLAAAGLVALRQMTGRLHEDHANACALAEGLAKLPYIQLDLSKVQSNMIYFELAETAPIQPKVLSERLKADYHILIAPSGQTRRFRAVTHYWISRENVEQTLEAIGKLLVQ
jgi:threonine aldolase